MDISNVPIFSTGKWRGKGSAEGGDEITTDFLDSVVSTFKAVGAKVKPRLILGHDKLQSEKFSGMPAVGWITDLKRDGNILYANLKEVPEKIKNLIDKKAYGRLSPAFFKKLNIDEKEYINVLDHTALLGAELPADMDLDYMLTNVYENYQIDLEYTEQSQSVTIPKGDNMDELQEKLELLEKEKIKLEKDLNDNRLYMAELENKNKELLLNVEEEKKLKHNAELNFMLDKKIEEGKLLPSQKSILFALCSDSESIRSYSYIENNEQKKVEGKEIDLLKSFLDIQPKVVNFQEQAQAVVPENLNEDDKIHKFALNYAKENNVSYSEAVRAYRGEK